MQWSAAPDDRWELQVPARPVTWRVNVDGWRLAIVPCPERGLRPRPTTTQPTAKCPFSDRSRHHRSVKNDFGHLRIVHNDFALDDRHDLLIPKRLADGCRHHFEWFGEQELSDLIRLSAARPDDTFFHNIPATGGSQPHPHGQVLAQRCPLFDQPGQRLPGSSRRLVAELVAWPVAALKFTGGAPRRVAQATLALVEAMKDQPPSLVFHSGSAFLIPRRAFTVTASSPFKTNMGAAEVAGLFLTEHADTPALCTDSVRRMWLARRLFAGLLEAGEPDPLFWMASASIRGAIQTIF